jgi:hypothetical protein
MRVGRSVSGVQLIPSSLPPCTVRRCQHLCPLHDVGQRLLELIKGGCWCSSASNEKHIPTALHWCTTHKVLEPTPELVPHHRPAGYSAAYSKAKPRIRKLVWSCPEHQQGVSPRDTLFSQGLEVPLTAEAAFKPRGLHSRALVMSSRSHTVSRCRPFRRRRASRFFPPRELIRATKPCRLMRRRFFGCHVRFGTGDHFSSKWIW